MLDSIGASIASIVSETIVLVMFVAYAQKHHYLRLGMILKHIYKYVVEYTTNNVVIPDSYKNTKDNALDLSALLIDKISSIIGGSKENVDELD